MYKDKLGRTYEIKRNFLLLFLLFDIGEVKIIRGRRFCRC